MSGKEAGGGVRIGEKKVSLPTPKFLFYFFIFLFFPELRWLGFGCNIHCQLVTMEMVAQKMARISH